MRLPDNLPFDGRGRAPVRALKLLLVAVAGSMASAAVYTSVLIAEREDTLARVSRYSITWGASQAVSELTRLQQRLAAYAAHPASGGVDRDEVQLRLDIVANRIELLRRAGTEEFLGLHPEHRATVQDLAAAVQAAQPLADALEESGSARSLADLFAPFDQRLASLAAAANVHGADRVAEDQRQLSRLHWTFSGILGALFVCGMGMLILLAWHNRLLRKVHRELLTRTTELRTQNARFDAALTHMSQGLCMVDAEQRLIVCNQPYLELFGLPAAAAKPGRGIDDILRAAGTGGRYPKELSESVQMEQRALVQQRRSGSIVREHADGRALAVSHQPMPGGGWIATYEDVTERRRAEARIAYLAHHDVLTGLPNRVLFRHRLEECLCVPGAQGHGLGVLCLDLDHFKEVNDSLGHPAGDVLLKLVAERLRRCVREDDTVTRLGGDEFAILQKAAPGQAAADASALAARLVETLGAPYDLEGHRIVIGVSVGIALAPDRGADPDQLLRNADLALYSAKACGRGVARFFEPEMEESLQARRALHADLVLALERHEFEVFYQPQVSVRTGRITGCEALLRWRHPDRGMVMPAEFIRAAEETNLIVPIGEWVLRQACADATCWPDGMSVAVNLSPLQFRSPNLVRAVSDALAVSGLAPDRLELEITESVLLDEDERAHAVLHELRRIGLRLALDDFGTGYSSLSYLPRFPFDKIKIDQSFVRGMMRRADYASIVDAVIGLASNLGMATIAEGVETEEQLQFLRRKGCAEAQGYLFGRPTPAEEVLGRAMRAMAETG